MRGVAGSDAQFPERVLQPAEHLESRRYLVSKLERVEVANERNLETNFPGAAEPDYSYKKLETLMRYYMSTRDGKRSTMSLKEILETIQREG